MLRFDETRRRPRNYLLRAEQTRLLMLVATLGLVVVAMQQVRGPRAVAVLGQLFDDASVATPTADAAPAVEEPGQPANATHAPATLDPAPFTAVRDNTFFRSQETDAWFYALGELRTAAPASAPTVSYAQLAAQPDAYRGRAVEVIGAARLVRRETPSENDLGIERFYRVVVQPRGGEVWPITIYCLEPPAGLPVGEEINAPVRVVGYFFKNQSYRWRDGMGITPVVLAHSVDLTTAPTTTNEADAPIDPLTILITAGAISVAAIGFFLLRTSPPQRPAQSKPITIDAPDPAEPVA